MKKQLDYYSPRTCQHDCETCGIVDCGNIYSKNLYAESYGKNKSNRHKINLIFKRKIGGSIYAIKKQKCSSYEHMLFKKYGNRIVRNSFCLDGMGNGSYYKKYFKNKKN